MKTQSHSTPHSTTEDAVVGQYKVLLVDDSRDSVAVTQAFLSDPRIQLTVSGDGEQGVQAFKDSVFDLVLMDIQMPVLDGCAATLEIRRWEADNALQLTPITALTASCTTRELARIFASGCSSYLPKPVTKTILLQAVRQFLSVPPRNAA
jgi:two-component system sensor histidine kinase/response regulator